MTEEEQLLLEKRILDLENESKKSQAEIAYLQGFVKGLDKRLTEIVD